jgi:hypothetical protein
VLLAARRAKRRGSFGPFCTDHDPARLAAGAARRYTHSARLARIIHDGACRGGGDRCAS